MTERTLPAYSQLLDVTDPEFKRRACGAATLAMVLGACGLENPPSVDDVLARGIELDAHEEGRGWRHRELAAVARTYGVHAHPEDWSGDPPQYAWEHLEDHVARGTVIVSVAKEFSPSQASHLVALCALDGGTATVYDPFRETREEVRYEVPLAFLKEHWTQRIICVHPPAR
jgi:hypothetical protein